MENDIQFPIIDLKNDFSFKSTNEFELDSLRYKLSTLPKLNDSNEFKLNNPYNLHREAQLPQKDYFTSYFENNGPNNTFVIDRKEEKIELPEVKHNRHSISYSNEKSRPKKKSLILKLPEKLEVKEDSMENTEEDESTEKIPIESYPPTHRRSSPFPTPLTNRSYIDNYLKAKLANNSQPSYSTTYNKRVMFNFGFGNYKHFNTNELTKAEKQERQNIRNNYGRYAQKRNNELLRDLNPRPTTLALIHSKNPIVRRYIIENDEPEEEFVIKTIKILNYQ